MGLNASEILGLLEQEEVHSRPVDVVMMPPIESDISDEDSDNEEDVLPKDLNRLGQGTLAESADLVLYDDDDDDLPEVMEVDQAGNLQAVEEEETRGEKEKGTKRKRAYQLRSVKRGHQDQLQVEEAEDAGDGGVVDVEEEEEAEEAEDIAGNGGDQEEKLRRLKNKDRVWSDKVSESKVPEFIELPFIPVPDNCNSPYDFFKLFIDDEFIDQIVEESVSYATLCNQTGHAAKINHSSMRVFQAVMFITGYSTPANRKMFWEMREDGMNMLVKKNIARDDFISIIRYSHFASTPNPDDRFWKVRMLFDKLNATAKKFVRQPEHVAVDEGMIKYFGPHPLKQFMRGKPTRFGYKIWILATSDGQLLACQPYAGAATAIKAYGLGQGPDVVYGLAEQFGLLPGSKVQLFIFFYCTDINKSSKIKMSMNISG